MDKGVTARPAAEKNTGRRSLQLSTVVTSQLSKPPTLQSDGAFLDTYIQSLDKSRKRDNSSWTPVTTTASGRIDWSEEPADNVTSRARKISKAADIDGEYMLHTIISSDHQEDTTTDTSDDNSDEATEATERSHDQHSHMTDSASSGLKTRRPDDVTRKSGKNSRRAGLRPPFKTDSSKSPKQEGSADRRAQTFDVQPVSIGNLIEPKDITGKGTISGAGSRTSPSEIINSPCYKNAPPNTAVIPAISPTPGWFAKFYERYTRPSWDPSPYKASCDRPAWDHEIYIDARERLLRHEAAKVRRPGRYYHQYQYPAYPVQVVPCQQYTAAIPYPQALFEAALMQSACFQRSRSSVRTQSGATSTASKSGTPRQHGSPHRTAYTRMSVTASTISSSAKISSKRNSFSVPGRTIGRRTAKSSEARIDGNNNETDKIIICPAKVVQSKASTKSDYSSAWRKLESALKQKAYMQGDSIVATPTEFEQMPNSPSVSVPRVAFLSKPNCRQSKSGNGGYYSQSVIPGIPEYDDRGRIQPKWDPSPYVPVGKKSVWDDTMPKLDFYRLRRMGWT